MEFLSPASQRRPQISYLKLNKLIHTSCIDLKLHKLVHRSCLKLHELVHRSCIDLRKLSHLHTYMLVYFDWLSMDCESFNKAVSRVLPLNAALMQLTLLMYTMKKLLYFTYICLCHLGFAEFVGVGGLGQKWPKTKLFCATSPVNQVCAGLSGSTAQLHWDMLAELLQLPFQSMLSVLVLVQTEPNCLRPSCLGNPIHAGTILEFIVQYLMLHYSDRKDSFRFGI